jgi:hypothetical protein
VSRERLGEAWARSDRVTARRVGERTVLVPLAGDGVDLDGALDLNRVAAFIWDELDGARSVAAIVDSVVDRFDVERDRAEADALDLLEALRAREAVVPGSSLTGRRSGG